jgi:hypothetical protein
LTPLRVIGASCREACSDPALWAHHDRLLSIDTDPEMLLELIELAITWASSTIPASPSPARESGRLSPIGIAGRFRNAPIEHSI